MGILSSLIKTAPYVHLRNFEQQVSLKKEEEREKLVFGWKIEDVANIWITGREIFLAKKPVSRHYGMAPVDPCRPQNSGSHDYLRTHKGSRRVSRPLIQDPSVRVLFPRYKGNLT